MKPRHLALTGSIGMGKSTTAGFFAQAGIPVWDADAAVHRLYQPDAPGTNEIYRLCPNATGPEGVNRDILKEAIRNTPGLLAKVENAIHPLVQQERRNFQQYTKADLTLSDIPLLFETGTENEFVAVVVVTAPPEVQRARVLSRDGMTEQQFQSILARQIPDAEKRKRATYLIDTSHGLDAARDAVLSIIEDQRK